MLIEWLQRLLLPSVTEWPADLQLSCELIKCCNQCWPFCCLGLCLPTSVVLFLWRQNGCSSARPSKATPDLMVLLALALMSLASDRDLVSCTSKPITVSRELGYAVWLSPVRSYPMNQFLWTGCMFFLVLGMVFKLQLHASALTLVLSVFLVLFFSTTHVTF